MAEVRRPQGLTRRMGASVQIDHTPRMRPRNVQQEDALQLRGIDDLETRSVEESRSAGRFAADKRRIQVRGGRAVLIKRARPVLKRNVGGAREPTEPRADLPIPLLILRRSEIDTTVRPARRGFRRRRLLRGRLRKQSLNADKRHHDRYNRTFQLTSSTFQLFRFSTSA